MIPFFNTLNFPSEYRRSPWAPSVDPVAGHGFEVELDLARDGLLDLPVNHVQPLGPGSDHGPVHHHLREQDVESLYLSFSRSVPPLPEPREVAESVSPLR
jgi:hypothetical protein